MAFRRPGFPGRFPASPIFSIPSEGVRFDQSPGSLSDGYVWVWRTGRLDFDQYVLPKHDDRGQIVVPLLEIQAVIMLVAEAVASTAYDNLFGHRRLGRGRRFDWFIGVSPTITGPDGVTVSWDDLDFPGRRPSRAGTHQQAFCPPAGFAHLALRSWNPRKGVAAVLRPFLVDFSPKTSASVTPASFRCSTGTHRGGLEL